MDSFLTAVENTASIMCQPAMVSMGSLMAVDDEEDDEEAIVMWLDGHNNEQQQLLLVHPEPITDLLACPRILTRSMMDQLHQSLPSDALRMYSWERCFCIGRDGDSFRTMLAQCRPYTYTLVVVQTTNHAVLGGFASETWQDDDEHAKRSRRRKEYYGNGQSFLFASHPENNNHVYSSHNHDDNGNNNIEITASEQAMVRLVSMDCGDDEDDQYHCEDENRNCANECGPGRTKTKTTSDYYKHSVLPAAAGHSDDDNNDQPLSIHKWSGANDYFQILDSGNGKLAMGGGGGVGSFGWIVQDNFSKGQTGMCCTYNNPPLVVPTTTSGTGSGGGGGIFEIAAFEIYGLQPLQL